MNFMVNFARTAAVAAVFALAAPVLGGTGWVASIVGSVQAEAAVVSSVTVQGNRRVEATTIRNYVTIKPGASFGPADIDASVRSLYATGLFSDVTVAQRGNTLVVTVVENQVVNSVVFQGNKRIKSNILVTLVDTKSRGVLTESQLQADRQRVEDYYNRSGRSNATVETRVTPLDSNRVDVAFVINEGGRTGVKTISFVGNDVYSDHRLRGVIQTRKTNWLSWLNRKDVYDPAKIDADEELLRRFYMRHGFADFRVLSSDVTEDDSGNYHVTFTVEEGARYRFGSVTIDSSIEGVDVSSLNRLVKIREGKVFNSTLVERSIEDITIALARQGYSFAQVRPRGDRDYNDNTIDVTLLIDEGPRVYVERIDVYGNTKTRDYVIRREFTIAEGDAYNRVLVDRTERRLRSLGFFQTVAITTEPGSLPDRVIINVSVTENQTGSFQIGGGYSTSDGFIAEISMEEKNFLGRGQYLKVGYGLGEETNSYSLSFTDPYFLGYRMSAGFDLFGRELDKTSNRPYELESYGGGIRIGLPLTEDLDLTFNYKLTLNKFSNITAPPDSTNDATPYYEAGDVITSSLGYALTYSTIDNRLDPRDGVFFRLNQDFAGVGGDVAYVKTVADARLYKELLYDTNIVGMVRLRGGNITGLGEDVRTADNFFIGGETIRGFAPYGIGPRDDGGTYDGLALGGKNYVAATAEVQFPMPFLPPDFGLRGAVFADAGTVFGYDRPAGVASANVNDDNSIRSSVGASLLWASPFGLLRADFAHALTKEDYDKTQVFRFSAGTQF